MHEHDKDPSLLKNCKVLRRSLNFVNTSLAIVCFSRMGTINGWYFSTCTCMNLALLVPSSLLICLEVMMWYLLVMYSRIRIGISRMKTYGIMATTTMMIPTICSTHCNSKETMSMCRIRQNLIERMNKIIQYGSFQPTEIL